MFSRRKFLQTGLAAGVLAASRLGSRAQWPASFSFEPGRALIPAPDNPGDWPEFRRRLAVWREQRQRELDYDGALYHRPEFAWASRCFACGFLMLCDEMFYDHRQDRYRVEEFLEQGQREFGGYDAVVLWHAYPRIGFDERNQFDFYRDQPGGLPGLRKAVRELHSHGVRAFVDYNPWDTGTRREDRSDLDALVEIIRAMEADGVFLDTMDQGAAEFRAKLDAAHPGVVLESEIALPLERIADHHLSWAQWFADSDVPGVLRNKWFERRHLQHQIKRWDRDHTGELHSAWMNGSGMMVWENVFGSWVGWNARDRSILRSMLPIQRRFTGLFTDGDWTPLVPTEQHKLYASEWRGREVRLWTLVNRSTETVAGELLKVSATGGKFFDLIHGQELNPGRHNDGVVLSGKLPPRGIGCFAAISPALVRGGSWRGFLTRQRSLSKRSDWGMSFPERHARLVIPRATSRQPQAPAGMREIPAAKFTLTVEFRARECGFYESSDPTGFAGPALHQIRDFKRAVRLDRYAMDETPVTNSEFAQFLKATRYRPRCAENFLRHWHRGAPPRSREDHPVVYVDLEDARAYARWAGKRLPTEEEWQYAAEGPQHSRFPWGEESPAQIGYNRPGKGTAPVRAFPQGRSAFGCYDMCGNIWHWTESERSDGRTRFCILKGGSWFQAGGSVWYADGGPLPCRFAAKFLLMWPGLDRCSTIGFRCVCDLEDD